MRDVWRSGESAVLLVLIMFTGSLVMWIGVPVFWLWVASRVQAATDSLGAGVAAALFGAPISIVLIAGLLGWLSDQHRRLRVARGHEDLGHFVLEVVLVVSAFVTIVGFSAWFFLFSGSSPIPVNVGY
jgi:hypothetical protein